ncbi:MAG: DUF4157 domain-containing protein [Nostoc sp.]|uniref:eCIS core domain-containing protein n=1 Tax=Nostoc sp. TaxID=1180 RepID=UPI002FF8D290
MREHVSQSKKATTASFSIPSLKHRIPGFGLDSSQASPQAVPLEQPLNKPLTHDISRMSLHRPQAKLSISQPGDKYEQEADETARQVVQRIHQPHSDKLQRESLPEDDELQMKPERSIQRESLPEEDELQMKPMVQRRASDGGIAASPDLETSIQQARGSGQPLADSIKSPMEQAFRADFSGVKVHTDTQADQLNQSIQAKAFTTGQDVFFRQGAYDPGSRGGQELLAHELTHVVQQNGAQIQRQSMPISFSSQGVIQRLTYTDRPTTWTPVDQVTRSEEGLFGVFFVRKGTDTIVVRPTDDPGNVEFANKFLAQGMGFQAPELKTYKKNEAEGTAIENLLLANTNAGKTPDEIQQQVDAANYYIVMSKIDGKSIQTLDDNEAATFIQDRAALTDVGRLMVADAFIGNDDRLVGGTVNLGNFFYQVAGQFQQAGIATIDNDSNFRASTPDMNYLGNKLAKIEILIHQTNRNQYINQFINRFRQAHGNNPNALQAVNDNFVINNVSAGITRGLQDMANVFQTNRDLIRSLHSINDTYGETETRDVSTAKGLAQYVANRVGNVNQTTAVERLRSYIEYRAKRNKTPKGLKWVRKILN